MTAGGEQVDRRLADVHAKRAELLNRVDDEQHAGGTAQSTERAEVDPVAVAPLHGADDDRARVLVHDACERLRRQRAALVAREPHFGDAALLRKLHERDGDLEELEVGDDDVVSRLERDRERRDAQSLRRALDESDLVLAGAEQRRRLTAGAVAQAVEREMVLGRVSLLALRAPPRHLFHGVRGLGRGDADAGAVEERRLSQAGERRACLDEIHVRMVRRLPAPRIVTDY